MNLRIHSLHCYPVKSLRGLDLPAAELTARGLRHDRHWLIIDRHGQFLSQRHLPVMAQIRTALDPGALTLEFDDLEPLRVPFRAEGGAAGVTEVWGDRCEVLDEGEAPARWLASVLGEDRGPRLVRMRPDYARPQKRPGRYGPHTTQFADTAPFLVANRASLGRLNEALEAKGETPVPMDRFRPNLVLDGLPAFGEDRLSRVSGANWALDLRYPRERCVITTIDQATAEKHPRGEPFRTLQSLNPMGGLTDQASNPKGPAFAQLATLGNGDGILVAVGDSVTAHG